MKRVAFIGHSNFIDKNIRKKLISAVEKQICSGCNFFTMGTRGSFDKEALSVCRELRKKYSNIKIEVVITSLKQIKPIVMRDAIFGTTVYRPYEDVLTVMYEIEEIHFKRRIIESNRRMIDCSSTLICYVNENLSRQSGAFSAFKYAKKKSLQIVNLFSPINAIE